MPERNASQQRPVCSVLNSLSLSLDEFQFLPYCMYVYIYIYIIMYNSNNSHSLAHVSMLYIVLIYASCFCAGSIQHYHQTAAEGGIQKFVSLGMGQNLLYHLGMHISLPAILVFTKKSTKV